MRFGVDPGQRGDSEVHWYICTNGISQQSALTRLRASHVLILLFAPCLGGRIKTGHYFRFSGLEKYERQSVESSD
jgi:hypothetical protein